VLQGKPSSAAGLKHKKAGNDTLPPAVSISKRDVERLFQLLELALEHLKLGGHVQAFFKIIKALFRPRKACAGNTGQLLSLFASVGFQFRCLCAKLPLKVLFKIFFSEFGHGWEVNGV
jgi:hypothetical protein